MTESELERAKVIIKIDEIKRQKEEWERQKLENDRLFAAAWQEFGSELGGSTDEDRRIKLGLAEATKSHDVLLRYSEGLLDISDAEETKSKRHISQLDSQIEELQTIKRDEESRVADILLARKLIA